MKIYLAGSITGLSYENAIGWRNKATEELEQLGFIVFNPMRQKEHKKHMQVLPNEHGTEYGRQYWLQDKFDIEQSDLLLVNFTGCKIVSIGTCVEIGMAVQLGISFVVVMEDNNVHQHPFITEPAELVTDNLETAIEFLWKPNSRQNF